MAVSNLPHTGTGDVVLYAAPHGNRNRKGGDNIPDAALPGRRNRNWRGGGNVFAILGRVAGTEEETR